MKTNKIASNFPATKLKNPHGHHEVKNGCCDVDYPHWYAEDLEVRHVPVHMGANGWYSCDCNECKLFGSYGTGPEDAEGAD